MAEIKRLLGSTRLLTLTGLGGCGKTRLALQIAGQLRGEFPDGVWMVDLAPVSNPRLLSRTIAATLDIPEQPGQVVLDTLVDLLRSKALLLVLDNCEHLRAVCGDIANNLLRDCPDLRIVATSREPLGIAGEIRWIVPPLAIPDPYEPASPEQLMKYDAVRLFVDRAAAAQSTFALTKANADAVSSLCQQLDGIPLGIEMAAPWVRMLTVEEILSRLVRRFELLANESRTAPPRHQTLKAAMDWSYGLLPEPERLLLSRLSVFAGGWTLDAAEAVCSGKSIDRTSILSLLTHLVDKSLVAAETGSGDARYRLLETIRQYARDKLVELGDVAEVQARHRDWYLDLAERANAELRGPKQIAWLKRLETEQDNLRVALEWSKGSENGAGPWLRLVAALEWFWFTRGHFTEGREWLEGALAASIDEASPARAWALCGAGQFAWRQGDSRGGLLLQQSLGLFQNLKDHWGSAYALHHLSHVAEGRGEVDQARDMLEQSVALFRDVGDQWGIGWSLLCLGDLAHLQGDDPRASRLLEESLVLTRAAGSAHTLAYVLDSLGTIAEARGDHERATTLLEESLALAKQVGSRYHIPRLLCELASVALVRRDNVRALALYKESVVLRQEVGDKPGLSVSFDGLAEVASAQGNHEKAGRLFGVAEALRETGFKRWPYPAGHDKRVVATRKALGEEGFRARWAEGRAMTLGQAIEYALAQKAQRLMSAKSVARERPGILAPRERQVSSLIAEGKTNREIAAQLAISEGTVEAHVQHILNKLGVNTRSQIAAWMVTQRTESPNP